jgi:hypothetical protein
MIPTPTLMNHESRNRICVFFMPFAFWEHIMGGPEQGKVTAGRSLATPRDFASGLPLRHARYTASACQSR